jgi:putative FmdB family regulatory protein
MPMYEFQCPNCGVVITELCRMGDTGESLVCSVCGLAGLVKQISGFVSPRVARGGKGENCSPGCRGNCTNCH